MTESTDPNRASDTDAALALQLDRLMRQFHAAHHPLASRVDIEKIGPLGGMILFAIGEHGAVTAQKLAHSVGRDKAHVSRIVKRLVRVELVETRIDDQDGRYIWLSLSQKGQLRVTQFQTTMVASVRALLSPLAPHEVAQFSQLLDKILTPGTAVKDIAAAYIDD